MIDGYPEQALPAFCRCGHMLPKLSNSPFRTPPRNACHSPDVNRRTGPSESLLSRTPISPSGRLATSTQLPLEKLRELLIQPKPGLPRPPLAYFFPRPHLAECRVIFGLDLQLRGVLYQLLRAPAGYLTRLRPWIAYSMFPLVGRSS